MARRLLWALDVGSLCGFAFGDCTPGAFPTSGSWRLKGPADHPAVAGSNLLYMLNEHWGAEKPWLVVKEAPIEAAAQLNMGNASHTVGVTNGLHAIVEAMCVRHRVPFDNVHASTIRKHFIGVGTMGNRERTKAEVVKRCRLLKFVPPECADEDRCDACATFDYAAAAYGNTRIPRELHLFGEVGAP